MAETTLNSLITSINTDIKTVSFGDSITTRGLCYLQEKDGKTFPLENTGLRNGNKISWDDKYPLQTYHRILSTERENDASRGFGKYSFRQRIYEMRLVGIGSRARLTTNNYEDNQEFANAVADVLPEFISSQDSLEVGEIQVIKQEVYDEEFAGIDHQKVYSLEGIAFWIDYTLRVTICTKPSAPTNLEASAENQTVTLTWQ